MIRRLRAAALLAAAAFIASGSALAQVPVEGGRRARQPQPLAAHPGLLNYAAGLPLEIRNPNLRGNGWNEATSLIYSRLFHVSLEGAIAPDLVERTKISKKGLVWTLRLRKNVLWHDGRPFTSRDVRATMESVFDPNTPCDLDLNLPMVVSFEYPDDFTVIVRLDRPSPLLAVPLSEIAILPAPEAGGSAATVGTGPYRAAGTPEGGQMVFTRYEGFHLGAPAIEKIVLKEIPNDAERAKALVEGTVDVAPLASWNLLTLVGRPDLRVARMRTGAWRGMALNLRRPALQDRRVRQAIDLSLDRDEIALFALPKGGTAAYQPVPPGSWAFSEEMNQPYRDLGTAKRLLEEAGWTLGEDGLRRRMPAGGPLTLRLIVWKDETFRRTAAGIIQKQLKEIGVQVDLVEVDNAEYERLSSEMGEDHDAFIGGWGSLLDPWDNLFKKFHSGGSQNYMGFRNETIDRMLDEARLATEPEAGKDLYLRLMRQLREEAVLLPLVYPDYLYGIASTVTSLSHAVVDSWYEFPRNAYLWRKDR